MNKTTTVTILLIVTIAIIAGCVGNEQTVKTPSGDVKISQGSGTGPDWCKAGTKITASSPEGEGSFTIKGITTYQGKDVCESEWTTTDGTMTQYFNEDGSFTATVMKDKTGKVIREFNYSAPK